MNSISSSSACYRHPSHKAGVKCQRCDKPICPSCMVPASVGFQCPECAGIKREGAAFRQGGASSGGGARRSARPWSKQRRRIPPGQYVSSGSIRQTPSIFTTLIILVNIAIFVIVVYQAGTPFPGSEILDIQRDYGLADVFLDSRFRLNEWWRIFTSGFIHSGLFHILFNMFLFWLVGNLLEREFGPFRLGVLYMTCLVGGSFGALLLQGPRTITVGASGGVFGLMGAYVVLTKFSGQRVMSSPIAFLLMLNILFSFVLSNISLGGHLGGLVAGLVIGVVYTYLADLIPSGLRRETLVYGITCLMGALLFWGCLLIADGVR